MSVMVMCKKHGKVCVDSSDCVEDLLQDSITRDSWSQSISSLSVPDDGDEARVEDMSESRSNGSGHKIRRRPSLKSSHSGISKQKKDKYPCIPLSDNSQSEPIIKEKYNIPKRVWDNHSYIPESGSSRSEPRSSNKLVSILSLGIILLLIGIALPIDLISRSGNKADDTFRKEVLEFGKLFPSQNRNIWSYFISNIMEIKKKPFAPSVFLLLYNNGNEQTVQCLTSKIGNLAAEFLSSQSYNPFTLNGVDIKHNKTVHDYGEYLQYFKEGTRNKRVIIVYNLQEIPAIMAQIFHSLCDNEHPLIKEVAYFLTLKLNSPKINKNPTEIAENYLKALWKEGIKNDILGPLITRITNTVIVIEHENSIPCSL